tara:strand:+ start:993 stop:1358 length:366 start_codon:yes stop_codon:yes gene_type:complete
MNGNIEMIISFGQFIIASIGMVAAILTPLMIGLMKINRSQQATNVRLDNVEKNATANVPKMDKVIELESRVVSLEKHRSDIEPSRIKMISMLAVINTKLDANTDSMKLIWKYINSNKNETS